MADITLASLIGPQPLTLTGAVTGTGTGTITTTLTASSVLSSLLTVDGAASGLDADLLDGQQGTYYLDLTNATGTLADARLTANIARLDTAQTFTGIKTLNVASATDNSINGSTTTITSPKHTVSLFLGPIENVSGYTSNESSGNIRFNGAGVAWGDFGFYPTGGSTLGNFRFSAAGGAIETGANASLGAYYFISTVPTGNAPLKVSSTTVVTNLNADLLDGLNSTAFAQLTGATFTGLLNTTNRITIGPFDNGATRLSVAADAAGPAFGVQHQAVGNGDTVASIVMGNSLTGAVDMLKASGSSTGNMNILVQQNGSGRAVLQATVLGVGDAQTIWNINGAQVWSAGLDNSDGDWFKLSSNSNLGTNDCLAISPTTLNIMIPGGGAAVDNGDRLQVTGSISATGSINASGSISANSAIASSSNISAGGFVSAATTVTGQRIHAIGGYSPPTEAHVGMFYDGTNGYIRAIQNSVGYRPLRLDGSTTTLQASGSDIAVASATGLAITGTLTATGTFTSSSPNFNFGPTTGAAADSYGEVNFTNSFGIISFRQYTGGVGTQRAFIQGTNGGSLVAGSLTFFEVPISGTNRLLVSATGATVTGTLNATGGLNTVGLLAASNGALFGNDSNFNGSCQVNIAPNGTGVFSILDMRGNGNNPALGLNIATGGGESYLSCNTFVFRNAAQSGSYATLNSTGLTLTGTLTSSGNIIANGANGVVLFSADAANYNVSLSGTTVQVKSAGSVALVTGGVTRLLALSTGVEITGNLSITGIPTAPTAAPGTNTTQLATTAFVTAASGGGSRNTLTQITPVSGVVTINYALGDYFELTLTEPVTSWSFTNMPASNVGVTLAITIRQTGLQTVAWPAEFSWAGGTVGVVSSGFDTSDVLRIERGNLEGKFFAQLFNNVDLYFTPLSYFTSNEQGFWYSPSDITRYMGTKGPEIFFDPGVTSTTGYTTQDVSISMVNGRMRIEATGTFPQVIRYSSGLTIGKTYEVSADVEVQAGSSGNYGRVRFLPDSGGSFIVNPAVAGERLQQKYTFVAHSAGYSTAFDGANLVQYGAVGDVFFVDNVSIREVVSLDTASMFQDSAGTLPVTDVEQPVGLMLDRRFGLAKGSELVTNGNVDTNTTGWEALNVTLASVNSKLQMTSTGNDGHARQSVTTVVGEWYEFNGTIDNSGNGIKDLRIGISDGNGNYGAFTTIGPHRSIFKATSTVAWISAFVGSTVGQVSTYDSFSVRSISGNHATQSTTAAKMKLSARRNLLLSTEKFNLAAWTKRGTCTVSATVTAPDGTGQQISGLGTAGNDLFQQVAMTGQGLSNSIMIWPITTTGSLKLLNPQNTSQGEWTINLALLTTGQWNTITSAHAAVTVVTAFSGSAGAGGIHFTYPAGGGSMYLKNVQQVHGSIIGAYQRVNTVNDYDTVGFPHYLKADGVNDFMSVGAINLTSVGAMTLFAGVRKNSDAALSSIVEFSPNATTTAGAFALYGSLGAGANYAVYTRGTATNARSYSTYAATVTNVISASMLSTAANSTASQSIKVNDATQTGVEQVTGNSTGNYGNHILYIGMREGTSNAFDGNIYELIGRAAVTDAAGITKGNAHINNKTGAY